MLLPDGDEERRVQVVLGSVGAAGERSIGIHSRGPGDHDWTLHAEGRLAPGAVATAADEGPDASDALEAAGVAEHYAGLAVLGTEYGPVFRRLDRLRRGAGRAVVDLSLPADLSKEGLDLHPALLDGVFQAVAVAGEMSDTLYLPFGWEHMQLGTPLPERLTCHVQVRGDAAALRGDRPETLVALGREDQPPQQDATFLRESRPETLIADIRLADDRGATVGVVAGFSARRATRAQLFAAIDSIEGLLCAPVWLPCPPAAPGESAAAGEPPGTWVIAAGDPGLGERLGEQLAGALAAGEPSVILAGPDAGPPARRPVRVRISAGFVRCPSGARNGASCSPASRPRRRSGASCTSPPPPAPAGPIRRPPPPRTSPAHWRSSRGSRMQE